MDIKRVGVVGTGLMDQGIAEVVARAGFEVAVRGRSTRSADACVGRLETSLNRQVDRGKLLADERDAALPGCGPSATWGSWSCASW